MKCCQCGKPLRPGAHPPSIREWCGNACVAAWEDANPVESSGWIRVENMTPLERAELEALIGRGEPC